MNNMNFVGIAFLKRGNYQSAIDVFKSFEKKDQGMIDQAATNLSFLYYLEGDMKNSEKYAELAVKTDRYNAKALVNRANYIFAKGDMESAKELYLEAIGVEADCVEAIYNLGLANKRLNNLDDALQAFRKLHRIIPKDPQVIYHIANLFDLMDDNLQATKWFKILHGVVPTDPKVLARLGALYNKDDDETHALAFHNFSDSYNCYPVNMEVISWLGLWYVRAELYEDAIQFFERASEIEPHEFKWQLMVASCYRRMGASTQALELYKKVHKQHPDNVECLMYMCTICKETNDPAYDEYNKLLRIAERAQATEQNRYMKDEVQDPGDQPQRQAGTETPTNSPGQQQRELGKDSALVNQKFNADVGDKSKGAAMNRGITNDDDDWGDGELGDDLLP